MSTTTRTAADARDYDNRTAARLEKFARQYDLEADRQAEAGDPEAPAYFARLAADARADAAAIRARAGRR